MPCNVSLIVVPGLADTGQEKKVTCLEADAEIYWTDAAGGEHTSTKKLRYPDDLDQVPETILHEWAREMLLRIARVEFGIEEWPE